MKRRDIVKGIIGLGALATFPWLVSCASGKESIPPFESPMLAPNNSPYITRDKGELALLELAKHADHRMAWMLFNYPLDELDVWIKLDYHDNGESFGVAIPADVLETIKYYKFEHEMLGAPMNINVSSYFLIPDTEIYPILNSIPANPHERDIFFRVLAAPSTKHLLLHDYNESVILKHGLDYDCSYIATSRGFVQFNPLDLSEYHHGENRARLHSTMMASKKAAIRMQDLEIMIDHLFRKGINVTYHF
ncbi:hypothetical protein H8D36_04790 [archaeon]|nr:hypothetical protein [archaeon]MBL7057115.1 hypothetical protein [Candidatus Woesearchaeota archaeon]